MRKKLDNKLESLNKKIEVINKQKAKLIREYVTDNIGKYFKSKSESLHWMTSMCGTSTDQFFGGYVKILAINGDYIKIRKVNMTFESSSYFGVEHKNMFVWRVKDFSGYSVDNISNEIFEPIDEEEIPGPVKKLFDSTLQMDSCFASTTMEEMNYTVDRILKEECAE